MIDFSSERFDESVWVLCLVSHSDFRVLGVFKSEALAKYYGLRVKSTHGEDLWLQEFLLDAPELRKCVRERCEGEWQTLSGSVDVRL